jgi:putative transport protein
MTGRPVRELFPDLRIFVERVRHGDRLIEADGSTVLFAGDIAAISGPRQALIERVDPLAREVGDQGLLNVPVTAVDVFVTNKTVNGRTLRELADLPFARGVYLRRITRNMVEIPVLPDMEVLRGDILTLAGSTRHVETAVAALGYADRPLEATDLMTVGGGIAVGALIGAVSVNWGGIPIGLSTSGGALLAGLLLRAGADEHARSQRLHRDRRHQCRPRLRHRAAAGGP